MSNASKSPPLPFMIGGLILVLAIVTWETQRAVYGGIATSSAMLSLQLMTVLFGLGEIGDWLCWVINSDVTEQGLTNLKRAVYRTDPKYISYADFMWMIELPAGVMRLFLCPILLVIMVKVFSVQKPTRLKRKFSMRTLSKESSAYLPHLVPVETLQLLDKDPDKGAYAREASPVRFSIMHGLIKAYQIDIYGDVDTSRVKRVRLGGANDASSEEEIVRDNLEDGINTLHDRCLFDDGEARNVFVRQLGRQYINFESLKDYEQMLVIILGLFASGKKDRALEIRDNVNRSFSKACIDEHQRVDPSKLDLSFSEDDKKVVFENLKIQVLKARHQYITTYLTGLLRLSRTKGKFSVIKLQWLKGVDRTLWYALHQEGCDAAWTEAAAVRGHMLAETKTGHRIQEPYVGRAVESLRRFLDEAEGYIRETGVEVSPNLEKLNAVVGDIHHG